MSVQYVSTIRELLHNWALVLKPTITYMFARITVMWKFILFLTAKPLLFRTSLTNTSSQCLQRHEHSLYQSLRTPGSAAEHIKSTLIIKKIFKYNNQIWCCYYFCKTNDCIKLHQSTKITRHNTTTDIFTFKKKALYIFFLACN